MPSGRAMEAMFAPMVTVPCCHVSLRAGGCAGASAADAASEVNARQIAASNACGRIMASPGGTYT